MRGPACPSSIHRTLGSARRWKDRRGGVVIEFALSVILLLTLIFGILEFALAFYTSEFVTYAARAGARYAMVRGSSCNSFATNCPATAAQIQTYVKTLTLPGINPAQLTMNTTTSVVWPDTSPASTATGCTAASLNTPGCAVQVKLTYSYYLPLPWVSTQTITLTAASEVLISQ